jgi:hypothetical protein
MPAVTDFANLAAAQAAGYVAIQQDRGANATYDRFVTVLEKWATLPSGAGAGHMRQATGTSMASQAAADTNAVNALNAQRRHEYGGAPGRASGDGNSPHSRGAATHTIDTT